MGFGLRAIQPSRPSSRVLSSPNPSYFRSISSTPDLQNPESAAATAAPEPPSSQPAHASTSGPPKMPSKSPSMDFPSRSPRDSPSSRPARSPALTYPASATTAASPPPETAACSSLRLRSRRSLSPRAPCRPSLAMDRAHRLGQRKVVNVHHLIMRGTLEEKVMSLQKFKVSVTNAVINAENASLNTMNTDQLLDLFTSSQTGRKGATTQSKSSNGSLYEDPKMGSGVKGLKTILSGLEELWDQSQYTEEYNLSQFLAKLNG